MKANSNTPYCPYCGKKAVLRNAAYVYGENAVVTHLYVCAGYPECDSFVGVHKDTLLPLGYLENGRLRRKRIEAHRMFDLLWKKGVFSRNQAYKWVQDKFCLTRSHAHIGYFSEYMCDQLIEESKKALENNKYELVSSRYA